MKESVHSLFSSISKWFHSLKRWQRNLLIFFVIVICSFWLLVITDVSEWWHWEEWMNHIRSEF